LDNSERETMGDIMKKNRRTAAFTFGAMLSCLALTAATARAAFIRAAASTCDIISDGQWFHIAANTIPTNDPNAGRMISTSSSYALKAYCPVVDTSTLSLSDPNVFAHVTTIANVGSSATAFQSQLCTDFQNVLGGVCDNSASAALGTGFQKIDIPISTAWRGAQGNNNDLHYIYAFVPTSGSGPSYLTGYTVW
jgi:hypothetical protein